MIVGRSVSLSIRPVRPRKPPIATGNIAALVEQQLGENGFAGAVLRDLTNYPPAQPWRSRPPKTGPRAGGRRTGTLGRNWKLGPFVRSGSSMSIQVFNDVPYAVFVEGPSRGAKGARQTAEMKRRGWPSITAVANARKRQYHIDNVRIFTQRDSRLK